jgi:hypothetical protein
MYRFGALYFHLQQEQFIFNCAETNLGNTVLLCQPIANSTVHTNTTFEHLAVTNSTPVAEKPRVPPQFLKD